MEFARALWLRAETIHAVTYFDPVAREAPATLGITGFWMGYFGCRAAPMGAVGPGVVDATFFNFAPGFVRRWVPAVWERASPPALVALRREAAARSLRGITAQIDAVATTVNERLAHAVGRCSPAGRPLLAGNRDQPVPDDPVEALWQHCTSLREHRGDSHIAVLTAAGIDGLEAHVLRALDQGVSADDLQKARGWTAGDWDEAVGRCDRRGLVDGGVLTTAGRALRAEVEATTDRLAALPFADLTDAEREAMVSALDPVARTVSSSGVIHYPNPIGMPAL